MNYNKKLIEALKKSGYLVRYITRRRGRGTEYIIKGIGKANFKYKKSAVKKAESLVQTRQYTLSEKAKAQRTEAIKKAQAARKELSTWTKMDRELYKEMRDLYKTKANKENLLRRYPGMKKTPSPSMFTSLRRTEKLQRYIDIMKGNIDSHNMFVLAEQLERAGRTYGVDVTQYVEKLRSGKYKMKFEEFNEFKDVLIDSNNPEYIDKQIDPQYTFLQLTDKLQAFFDNYKE